MDDMISRAAAIETVRKAQSIGQAHRMLIQLPSAQTDHIGEVTEMVGDAVSRAVVVDAIEGVDWYHMTDSGEMVHGANSVEHQAWYKAEDIYKAIEGVPSAQPGWIPTSERLPKPNEYENDVRQYYLVQNEYGDMMVCSWHGGFWMQMYRDTNVEDKVVAWMPLPKPWEKK